MHINILFPVVTFFVLFMPAIGSVPFLDGNIDFIKSHDFYQGGFDQLFANWNSVHPPLKELLALFAFKSFGFSAFSYTLLGITTGIIGVAFYYKLANKLFGAKVAGLASLILSTSGLFLAVGVFALTDFILTVLIIITFYFYLHQKHLLLALTISLALLTKETAGVLFIAILLVETISLLKEAFFKKLKLSSLAQLLLYFLPFATAIFWNYFLKLNNKNVWQDWSFSETNSKGTLYTIYINLISSSFLNKYAYQNWLQVFVLNFNWVYWAVIACGTSIYIFKTILGKQKLTIKLNQKNKTAAAMVVFFIIYFLAVLSFQTYTIPRYGLPLMPFIFLLFSYFLAKLTNFLSIPKHITAGLIIVFIFMQLFFSLDPVSIYFWKKANVLGEDFYSLNNTLAGNDGLTYNLQYLKIVRLRSKLMSQDCQKVARISKTDCYWLFPDINNDKKTVTILKLNKSCIRKVCTESNNYE